jgi:glycosyltransferase involved in cell wall biosynthesis
MTSQRPHVCIVTPSPIGSNPRVVKEADALFEAGYPVTVVATRTLDRVEPRDLALMARVRWQLVRIDLRSRWRWRLYRSVQMASRRAYGLVGGARLANIGFSSFTRPLSRAALKVPADFYIAHYPAALPAVAAAARRHGASFAYDAEDFHPGDWPDRPAHDMDRLLVRAIEARYLPQCAYVSAAAPGIADAYAQTYRINRPRVLLNVFPLSQSPQGATPKGNAVAAPSIYWFSQTIGPHRGLECAVRAIGMAHTKPHLYLRGTPAAGFATSLEEVASMAGAGDRLHLLPPAAPDEMERLAASYDLGLAAETEYSRNRLICLTNKLFSFLLAGVPPLMSDTPGQRAFAVEAGLTDLTYAIDDPGQLAALIDRLLGDDGALAAARSMAWRLGRERYNWDLEKTAFYDLLTCAGLPCANRQGIARGAAQSAGGPHKSAPL